MFIIFPSNESIQKLNPIFYRKKNFCWM